jgi:ribose 5-phosphate isomerase RpiB
MMGNGKVQAWNTNGQVGMMPLAREEGRVPSPWCFWQERSFPLVLSARQSLAREGISLAEIASATTPSRIALLVGEKLAQGTYLGGVAFCEDPGLVSLLANKLPGVRAVAVTTIFQAARALLSVGANLLAVEMPGRTYFEIRQIVRMLCTKEPARCPGEIASILQELEQHAHR